MDYIIDQIKAQASQKTTKTSYMEAFNRTNLRTTLVCFGIVFYHEVSGINVVLAYSGTIIRHI